MERKAAASSRLIKLVCVGDSAVGKSSLIERAVLGTWNSDQQTTIGLEFYRLALKLPDGSKVVCNVWDTAGQERFRAASLPALFYRDCAGVIICFDLSSVDTFQQCNKWFLEVQRHQPEGGTIPICVVGTKSDLTSQRQVSHAVASEFCKQRGVTFFETSAKGNENSRAPFEHLATCCARSTTASSGSGSGSGSSGESRGGSGGAGAAAGIVHDKRHSSRLDSPKRALDYMPGSRTSSFGSTNDVQLNSTQDPDSGGCCS